MEALRGAPSPLEEARAKREEHIADREKFAKLIDSLQARAAARTGISLVSSGRPASVHVSALLSSHAPQSWRQVQHLAGMVACYRGW